METKRYVLFSPIGMTDPISGNRDGSMLHIARKYKPEHVYLYLSQETAAFEEADGRYAGALVLLGEKLGHKFDVVKIFRPNLTAVHLFDEFYDDFENLLKQVKEENPGAAVLLNVSSGTPAMKSSLQVIAALDEDAGYIPVQVSTPRKAHNTHEDKPQDFDLELFWECDKDNDDYADRTSVSNNFSFMTKVKKEIIKRHIDAYDYHAALALAEESRKGISETAKIYLRAACARVQLDARETDRQLSAAQADGDTRAAFAPVREGDMRGMAEYLLWLGVKLKRGELCDFIRGFSPLFLDLLEILADKCYAEGTRIKMNDFCSSEKKRLMRDLLESSEAGCRILEILDPLFNGYRDSNLSSAQLAPIVTNLSPSQEVRGCVSKLRDAEEACRNRAAHEIVSVTEEWIRKECEMAPQDILAGLETLAEYSGIKRSRITGSYEKMNGLIKESLR